MAKERYIIPSDLKGGPYYNMFNNFMGKNSLVHKKPRIIIPIYRPKDDIVVLQEIQVRMVKESVLIKCLKSHKAYVLKNTMCSPTARKMPEKINGLLSWLKTDLVINDEENKSRKEKYEKC